MPNFENIFTWQKHRGIITFTLRLGSRFQDANRPPVSLSMLYTHGYLAEFSLITGSAEPQVVQIHIPSS